MKYIRPVVILLILLYPAPTQAQQASPQTLDEPIGPIGWPPQHMQNLPPDYLGRLRASLVAGTNRMGRLHLKNTKSTDSIGWVRYGQPSLILGQRVEEINKFFESDTFVWSLNPKFGFSLFAVSYMRM